MFKNPSFSLLFKANLLVTALLFVAFLNFNDGYSILTFGLSFLAAISSAAILVLVLYILLFIFSFWRKKGLYVVAALFIFLDLGIITDFFIYRIYHFHINAMVLNILTSPAAADSIQLGVAPYLAIAGIIISLFAFEWFVIKTIQKRSTEDTAALNRKLNKTILIPLFLIILIEKFSYGTAYMFGNSDITSKFRVIPLYQPLTFTKLASKYLGIKPKVEARITISDKKSLNYPLAPLQVSDKPNPVNIFIFASDAVRSSVITPEIAPNISAFAEQSWVYTNHYSGGNATRFGIFSIMYGLNGTYWFSFLNANRGAILFDILEQLDYQISIVSSTDTDWPEFRKTCYVNQQSCIKDDFQGTPHEKDRQSVDYLKNWLNKADPARPIFSFIFLDAPHSGTYPKEFAKFLPDMDKKINYLTIDESLKDVYLNQYKNAVFFNDALFGEIVNQLKAKKLYDNSVIIFTADHGQEFFEYGNFGHNSSFSRAQVQPALIIKLPGQTPKVITKLSSHADLVPTLLSYIGVQNSPADYSNGFDMLAPDYNRHYAFVSNWNNNAIITDQTTMVFSNTPNKMFENEIRSTKTYKKIPAKESDIDQTMILDVLNENRKFLK